MPLTVLEICREAVEEVGVDPPSSFIGDFGAQLLALANSTGRDLIIRADHSGGWQALRGEYTFPTLAQETQVANITTTFPNLRKFIDNTMWDRSEQRRIIGPVSAQAWQRMKSGLVSPATNVWMLRGNAILFASIPAAGNNIFFEGVDDRFASNSTATTFRNKFSAESDVPRINDYMFVLGVRWRFLQKKGMEYGEAFRQYEDYVSSCLSNDRPAEPISVNPYMRSEGFETQVPEGSWNL